MHSENGMRTPIMLQTALTAPLCYKTQDTDKYAINLHKINKIFVHFGSPCYTCEMGDIYTCED